VRMRKGTQFERAGTKVTTGVRGRQSLSLNTRKGGAPRLQKTEGKEKNRGVVAFLVGLS